jgi:hypothetical protein
MRLEILYKEPLLPASSVSNLTEQPHLLCFCFAILQINDVLLTLGHILPVCSIFLHTPALQIFSTCLNLPLSLLLRLLGALVLFLLSQLQVIPVSLFHC